MWPTFKQSVSDAFHPGRWKELSGIMKVDVLLIWASIFGIIFTSSVLYFAYVQAQDEIFEKTTLTGRFNISDTHAISGKITVFTIRDSDTQTEYIIYDHSNGIFDNQAFLLDVIKGKENTR
jgi:hypothetical protein